LSGGGKGGRTAGRDVAAAGEAGMTDG
jgi:hypothetical protein